jgi:hypothetical protein
MKSMMAALGDLSCFIATAVYRDPMAHELTVLRGFRDRVLLQSDPGARLVAFYYRNGPGWAQWIREHPGVAPYVRHALDRVVRWLDRTDLEDPRVRRDLGFWIDGADRMLSLFWSGEDNSEAKASGGEKHPTPLHPRLLLDAFQGEN